MGRLFWKIFLAFWVAMLLIAAVVAVATSQLAERLQGQAIERSDRLDELAAEAGDVLAVSGREGLTSWLAGVVDAGGTHFYIMDVDGGAELLGRRPPRPRDAQRPPPPRGRERRGDRPPPRRGVGPPGRRERSIDVRVIEGMGGRYHLLADLGLQPWDLFRSPLVAGVWVGLAIVISGTVCFFLAGYIVAPLRRMQRTTQRITAGEFEARVGAAPARRNDEIVDLGRDIDAMAEQIGRMLSSQRRLLRDLSHELRSPLARLQVALELARQRASEQAGSELDRIELEAERLNVLIGEILTLARLESSPHTLERSRVDLCELVRDVVDDAGYEAESSGRQVRLEAPGPLPYDGHEELLRRAVDNVVRNALRHTGAETSVEVSIRRGEATVTIEVRDHGPGVSQESLTRMFEPFVSHTQARVSHPVGHGIGLAITKRAVEVHGGRVVAANHPDGGLLVELRLPTAT